MDIDYSVLLSDTIMNKKWQYNEVEDLIQLQLATLPGKHSCYTVQVF